MGILSFLTEHTGAVMGAAGVIMFIDGVFGAVCMMVRHSVRTKGAADK